MSDLTTISAREANQRFSEILARVESEGRGFIVTKRGRPVARLVPLESPGREGLSPEKEAALRRILTTGWNLRVGKLNREDLYDRY